MTASWPEVLAARTGTHYNPTVLYSVGGAGSNMDGYPADLANALVDAGLPFIHQPIAYPAAAAPMGPSVDIGVNVLEGLMNGTVNGGMWNGRWYLPDLDAIGLFYSEGAIVGSTMFDDYRAGKLTGFKGKIVAAVTFGNPRRQAGHTIDFPGAIDPGGQGIVGPESANMPSWWWDFACGSKMLNSPGNDVYTTWGVGEDAQAAAYQQAVWKIVDQGSLKSVEEMALDVFEILPHFIPRSISAVEAAMNFLDFAVVKSLTPHTSYQIVQPVPGHDRDCWGMAYDYLYDVGINGPKSDTTKGSITMTEPVVEPEAAVSPLADLDTFKAEAEKFLADISGVDAFLEKYVGILPLPANLKTDLAELTKGLGFATTVLNAL